MFKAFILSGYFIMTRPTTTRNHHRYLTPAHTYHLHTHAHTHTHTQTNTQTHTHHTHIHTHTHTKTHTNTHTQTQTQNHSAFNEHVGFSKFQFIIDGQIRLPVA